MNWSAANWLKSNWSASNWTGQSSAPTSDISGNAPIVFTSAAEISALGWMSGASSFGISESGTVIALGHLAGLSSFGFSESGSLSSGNVYGDVVVTFAASGTMTATYPSRGILRTSGRATNPELFYDASVVIDALNILLDDNAITHPAYDAITFTVSQTGATNIELRRLVNYALYCVSALEDVIGVVVYVPPIIFLSSRTRATNWEMRADLDMVINYLANPISGDPYAADVVSLLRFDEADGATAFADDLGRTWVGASPGAIADAGSLLLDGSSGCYTTTDLSAFAFGTGDFTIEIWARVATLSPPSFYIDMRSYNLNGYFPCIYNDSAGSIFYLVNGVAEISTSSGVVTIDTTRHIAYCRSGSTGRLFVDGVQVGSWSDSSNYVSSGDYVVIGGGNQSVSYPMDGRIYAERITTAARYTADFTPPTLPLPAI